jgi:hypothetical protein
MFFKPRIAVVCFAVVLLAAAMASPFFVRAWRDFGLNQMAEQCRRAREQKDWDTLGALAVRWTDLEPNAGEAWMYRGQAAMARQDWSAAAEAFWKVPDSDALAVSAMTSGSSGWAARCASRPYRAGCARRPAPRRGLERWAAGLKKASWLRP